MRNILIVLILFLVSCEPERTAKQVRGTFPIKMYVIGIDKVDEYSGRYRTGNYYHIYYLNYLPEAKDTSLIISERIASKTPTYRFGDTLLLK